jgi:hypothetical protein
MTRSVLAALAVALAIPTVALAGDVHHSATGKKRVSVVAQAPKESSPNKEASSESKSSSSQTKTAANGKVTNKKARTKKVSKSGAKTSKSEVKSETTSNDSNKVQK